jgi:uncharacterized protein YcbK (DUF882 family)
MKYFKLDEFNCKCCGKNEMKKELLDRLDAARELAGVPFVIVSGYRCPKHNKEVGGVPDSAHTKGLAADIRATNGKERFKILQALMLTGFDRIGVYKNFIHCDVDSSKPDEVVWVGKDV